MRLEEAGSEELQRKEEEIANFEAKIARIQGKMKVTLEDLETAQQTHLDNSGKVFPLLTLADTECPSSRVLMRISGAIICSQCNNSCVGTTHLLSCVGTEC